MPRKTNKIPSHTTILLVVEGQTEQIYFSEMRIFERVPGISIVPKIAQHSDLYHVLKTALNEFNFGVYDSIWCVFDKDTLLSNNITDEVKTLLNKAINNGIKIADSFPAFEIWFLLHYEMPKQTYNNQDEVIKNLIKHISDYSKERKWQETKHLYAFLKKYQEQAILNSKRLNLQFSEAKNKSLCNVYKIIEEILSHK